MPSASPSPRPSPSISPSPTISPTPLSSPPPQARAGLEVPPLRPDGRWFRDATGRIVILQGTFTVEKPVSPTADGLAVTYPGYAEDLRELGMNSVRLAYHWSGLEAERGRYDLEYISRIRGVMDKLEAAGIFTLLDSHQDMFGPKYGARGNGFPDWAAIDYGVPMLTDLGFPGNYFQPPVSFAFDNLWWNTDGVLDAYTAQLGFMASQFTDYQYLLGYDLMNEPWAGSHYPSCFNLPGCPQFDALYLQPAMDAFAAAVRAQDANAIVFYEPQFTFDSGAKTWLGPPPEEVQPAGFSFHDLCVARAIRQVLEQQSLGTLLETACDPFHTQVYINAFEAAIRMGVPPFMTEVLASNERDTEGLECLLERAEDNKMSWNVGQYPSASNNNTVVLARVFPRAIAGSPEQYHFDPRTGWFDFLYQSDSSIQAPTLIAVPVSVHYPEGYRVRVEGGQVLSEPNAVELLIQADAQAEQVRVEFRPPEGDATERPALPDCTKPLDPILDVYQQLTAPSGTP
ncbi:MAG: cellulase family glycosylhydrolase [Oceanococcaceae bacterium]